MADQTPKKTGKTTRQILFSQGGLPMPPPSTTIPFDVKGPGAPAARQDTGADPLAVGRDSIRRSVAALEDEVEIDYAAVEEAYKVALAVMSTAAPEIADTSIVYEDEPRDSRDEIAAKELEAAVVELEHEHPWQGDVTAEDAEAEAATIVIQFLLAARGKKGQDLALKRLEDIRARNGSETVAKRLLVAIVSLAETCPIERFDPFLLSIRGFLRRLGAPLLEGVERFADLLGDQGREALWPHVVDEMLLFLLGRNEGIVRELELPPGHARMRAVRRLAQMPTLAKNKLDPQGFDLRQEFARPLFAELLETSAHAAVGPTVLAALRRRVPDEEWVANVVRLSPNYRAEIRPILAYALLEGDVDRKGHAEAFTLAADVLTEGIAELPPEKRDGPWVPGALVWLGNHGTLRSYDLLERILKERKGLFHVWSKECRRAARAAIREGWSKNADA